MGVGFDHFGVIVGWTGEREGRLGGACELAGGVGSMEGLLVAEYDEIRLWNV